MAACKKGLVLAHNKAAARKTRVRALSLYARRLDIVCGSTRILKDYSFLLKTAAGQNRNILMIYALTNSSVFSE